MTNLPTNPTKSELMERHWFEFLQYLQTEAVDKQLPSNLDGTFWSWYVNFKLTPKDQPPEQA